MALQVGTNIRTVRLRRGLTQRAVADLAGVSVRWLSDVERGGAGTGVRVDQLVRLAAVLNVEAPDLLSDRPEAIRLAPSAIL